TFCCPLLRRAQQEREDLAFEHFRNPIRQTAFVRILSEGVPMAKARKQTATTRAKSRVTRTTRKARKKIARTIAPKRSRRKPKSLTEKVTEQAQSVVDTLTGRR